MDVLVLTTMKNAAKCDTKSELQNPVNLYVFERMLRFRELLEACLFECLFSPLAFLSLATERETADCDPSRFLLESASIQVERRRDPRDKPLNRLSAGSLDQPTWCDFFIESKLSATSRSLIGQRSFPRIVRAKAHKPYGLAGLNPNFRTSNQARGPAEFKHITKRRKRN